MKNIGRRGGYFINWLYLTNEQAVKTAICKEEIFCTFSIHIIYIGHFLTFLKKLSYLFPNSDFSVIFIPGVKVTLRETSPIMEGYLFQKGKYMTKKFGLSVVAATLLASGVQAAEVSAPHNNVSFWGGVSASLTNQSENIQGNGETTDNNYFCLDTAVIGATVKADESNPFGGTVVAGNFAVKTVTGAKVVVKDPVTGESNFRTWLAHIDYIPVSNLMVNAGLLWQNFGEKPVDALNPHMTRTTDFVFQPVAMAGLRLTYDLGMAKVYAGLNDGSVLGGSHVATHLDVQNTSQKGFVNVVATNFSNTGTDGKNTGALDDNENATTTSGMELGVHVNLDPADVGVNYFSQNGDGMSTINLNAKEKMTGFDIGFGYNMHAAKTAVTANTVKAAYDLNDSQVNTIVDSVLGLTPGTAAAAGISESNPVAAVSDLSVNSMELRANVKVADNINIPVRYESTAIKLDNDSSIDATATDIEFVVNSLTITPTYNPTPASFIRAELVMTNSDEDVFVDADGEITDTRQTIALEFGVLF